MQKDFCLCTVDMVHRSLRMLRIGSRQVPRLLCLGFTRLGRSHHHGLAFGSLRDFEPLSKRSNRMNTTIYIVEVPI